MQNLNDLFKRRNIEKKLEDIKTSKKAEIPQGFIMVNNEFFSTKGVYTPCEKLLLIAFKMFQMNKGTCFPSKKTLVEITGFSKHTVNKSIKSLIAKKKLVLVRVSGKPNRYKASF